MMLTQDSMRLKSGELARIDLYQPDSSPLPATIDALWNMVIRPREPWISRVETVYFTRIIEGQLVETDVDASYSIWIDDQPAAHVALLMARDNRQVAQVGYVFTEPAFRGRGLCSLLMERVMDDFWAAGGQYAFLATANPVAHAIYARHGFREYNGHVMRYVTDTGEADDVDEMYFDYHGPAVARPGHWGDAARLAWLYAKPFTWFVKDYLEAIYYHPAITHTRCGSILPSMMLNVEERGGGLWVLETGDKRLVGAATLTYFDRVGQAVAPVVDFLVVPAYLDQAHDLLHLAIGAAETAGARLVRACLAACDAGKMDTLREAGFQPDVILAGQFAAGDDQYDLHIYTYEL